MEQKNTKQQMSLEEFKKEAKNFLKKEYPILMKEDAALMTRIEKESEGFWEDSWSPTAMVAGMVSNLI